MANVEPVLFAIEQPWQRDTTVNRAMNPQQLGAEIGEIIIPACDDTGGLIDCFDIDDYAVVAIPNFRPSVTAYGTKKGYMHPMMTSLLIRATLECSKPIVMAQKPQGSQEVLGELGALCKERPELFTIGYGSVQGFRRNIRQALSVHRTRVSTETGEA